MQHYFNLYKNRICSIVQFFKHCTFKHILKFELNFHSKTTPITKIIHLLCKSFYVCPHRAFDQNFYFGECFICDKAFLGVLRSRKLTVLKKGLDSSVCSQFLSLSSNTCEIWWIPCRLSERSLGDFFRLVILYILRIRPSYVV